MGSTGLKYPVSASVVVRTPLIKLNMLIQTLVVLFRLYKYDITILHPSIPLGDCNGVLAGLVSYWFEKAIRQMERW